MTRATLIIIIRVIVVITLLVIIATIMNIIIEICYILLPFLSFIFVLEFMSKTNIANANIYK